MSIVRFLSLIVLGSLVITIPAHAQSRRETLRIAIANNINGLDPAAFGVAREAVGLSMSTYDRLLTFEKKSTPDGLVYDDERVRGELAESFEVSPDGLKITFKLRKGSQWPDGTPITARDVKWSLDRAVTNKSLAAPQLASGSLTKPDQFRVLDPQTFEVSLDRPDRLALANLAHPVAQIINSELAKRHSTRDDPWANTWLKENDAGGGAYRVEAMVPGQSVTLLRNETWKNGLNAQLPYFKRVIIQTVSDPSARSVLIERSDADLSIDLQISDVISLEKRKAAKIQSVNQINGVTYLAVNNRMAPFDNIKVRQAIMHALPYEAMFKAAIYGRGKRLFDGSWTGNAPDGRWPQAMPFRIDIDKAKALLAEAGLGEGFKTTIAITVTNASVSEVAASLAKESLARIGIEAEIQKYPDSQFTSRIIENKFGILIDTAGAFHSSTDYVFRIFFQGDNRWNLSRWQNSEILDLTAKARFERDPVAYEQMTRRLVSLVAQETPMMPLWMPNQEAAMVANLQGHSFWFHRQPDIRELSRSALP